VLVRFISSPPRSRGAVRRGQASLRPAPGRDEAGRARADGGRAEQGWTAARPRARPRRGHGGAAEALAGRGERGPPSALRGSGRSSGGERAAGGAWQPRRIDPLPLPLSLPFCLAEEEELQRRAVRRSAASSHRAAEPPVRPPRRRSACATGPLPTRRAAVEKNGGGAAKSTCPMSTRAEPPRRCACCPAPCPRTNPTTREFQLPISSDRSNSPSTAVVIKNWLGTIWFYR